LTHAGEELEADDFARDHSFVSVDEVPKKIDRRLGTAQMIYGDAGVQQFHAGPCRFRRSFKSPRSASR
jgi:hypothetical protein